MDLQHLQALVVAETGLVTAAARRDQEAQCARRGIGRGAIRSHPETAATPHPLVRPHWPMHAASCSSPMTSAP